MIVKSQKSDFKENAGHVMEKKSLKNILFIYSLYRKRIWLVKSITYIATFFFSFFRKKVNIMVQVSPYAKWNQLLFHNITNECVHLFNEITRNVWHREIYKYIYIHCIIHVLFNIYTKNIQICMWCLVYIQCMHVWCPSFHQIDWEIFLILPCKMKVSLTLHLIYTGTCIHMHT